LDLRVVLSHSLAAWPLALATVAVTQCLESVHCVQCPQSLDSKVI
jgi:hypothetical protein